MQRQPRTLRTQGVQCPYDGTGNDYLGRSHERAIRHQGFAALAAHSRRALPVRFSLFARIQQLGSAGTRTWVAVGAVTFVILAACRLGSQVISKINTNYVALEARRTFHLTPIPFQCEWNAVPVKDGMVTAIQAGFLAKNRTNKTLHLATARVVRPKLPSEPFSVLIWEPPSNKFNSIPPDATIQILVSINIHGTPRRFPQNIDDYIKIMDAPRRARKNRYDLAAVLAVKDDEGNEVRVNLPLRFGPTNNPFR
jgi:hypothetical protein